MNELWTLMRPHQWSKNVLIFLGLLLGHQYGNLELVWQTLRCFAAFCFVASAGYIFNDYLDIEDDRNNPAKCMRPLAAGSVSMTKALVLGIVLILTGFAFAASINTWVLSSLAAYLVATVAYSSWIKRKLMMDIVTLAGLYTIRILAGIAVIQEFPSYWLLAFAMFMFFSLATLKRYIELKERDETALGSFSVRAYSPADGPMMSVLGISSGMLAVLVLAFYIRSPEVKEIYQYPALLWLLCPFFMYWVGRIWLLANRSEVHGDPILFALHDRASYFVAVIALVILVSAH